MKNARTTWLLLSTVAIVVAPLVIPGLGGSFKGSDDQGTDAISELRPGYKPWFEPLWKPPSDEIESLLFSLQAALGAGFIGYMIGRRSAVAKGSVAKGSVAKGPTTNEVSKTVAHVAVHDVNVAH